MAQGGNADFNGVVFREGRDGRKQQKHYEALLTQDIVPTRYASDSCLHNLGLYDSVYWMVDRLSLTHFYARKDPTYVSLTLEFLSSLVYTTNSWTSSTVGTTKFHMFNRAYEFSFNQMADLLQFPHGEGVICETPLDTDWPHEVGQFWGQLTGNQINSLKGNNAIQIYNPTIRYFCQMLAHTIFGWENKSRINANELFYMHSFF